MNDTRDVLWLFLIVTLIGVAVAIAASPRNPFPKTPDTVWQNDSDLNDSIKANYGAFPSRTLAQLKAAIPLKKGQAYYCSDCASADVCVATGTVVYGFASMAGRTTACN